MSDDQAARAELMRTPKASLDQTTDGERAVVAQSPLPERQPQPLDVILGDPAKLAEIDVDKLDRLMDLKLKADAEVARREFAAAFVAAQESIPSVEAHGRADRGITYARLEDVSRALDPIVQLHGFSQSFSTEPSPHGSEFTTLLYVVRHVGGHEERHRMDAPLDYTGLGGKPNKTKLQGVASAMTYAQRQLKLKVWNVQIGVDDDGANPANAAPITGEQVDQLLEGIEKTSSDVDQFCDLLGVDRLADITVANFKQARQSLVNKYRRQQAGEHERIVIALDSDLILRCEQGSDEWREARNGIPTASCFGQIAMRGRAKLPSIIRSSQRKTYMAKLLAEWVVGEPWQEMEGGFRGNHWVERGKALEPKARKRYAFDTGLKVESIGLIYRDDDRMVACSPDGLVVDDGRAVGGLELKCPAPHTFVMWLALGACPAEHVAQVQGGIYVTGAPWWEFAAYCPEIEGLDFWRIRVYPDPLWQEGLDAHVGAFVDELLQRREWLREQGVGPWVAPTADDLGETDAWGGVPW